MEMQGLSGICAGLGIAEEDDNGQRTGYSTGDTCSENLRDLLRFLRRDDPQTRDVFKQVCKWNIVSKNLIPIIQYCQDDRSLVLNAVKVLVFLTMPIEPSSNDIPQQIEYLWGLKSAITNSDVILAIVSLLETPLEDLERESFTEDDWKLVQLILTFFRNILAIQDISLPQKVGGSACELLSLRDRFLELLFQENVMDLIIIVTQHINGSYSYLHQDNLLLLEIYYYIFMGQDPELIANAKVCGDTKASLDGLKSIIDEEKEKRKLLIRRNTSRHSQFSGTFTRLAMDGSKAVYKGNPKAASSDVIRKPHKVQRGQTKRIMWDNGRLPTTKNNILELLHDFVNQFLSGGYNVLMESVLEDIEKDHHALQKSDIMAFIQVAQFVTSFQYHKFLTSKPNKGTDTPQPFTNAHADSTLFKGDICGPIAATMNESTFLMVISRWRNAFDMLKETKDYKFLSAAGALMRIMIRMLYLVLKLLPEDSKEPQTARILLYKLFYDQTDEGMSQFILNQIKSFDTHKQPKSDLADLVEIVHVTVKLMDNLQARGTLRVSKKSRMSRKKKAPNDLKGTGSEVPQDDTIIQDQSALSTAQHSSDLDMLQQNKEANASSDNQQVIDSTVQVDEPEISVLENLGGDLPQMDKISQLADRSCSSDDSSDDEQPPGSCEVDFKVSTFILAFANHNIIHNMCWLLRFYKSNSMSTNHYIICILRRIADDFDLSPMLYQLSLLVKFYDILEEQKSCPCKDYANIVDFLTSLVRRMLRKMKNQPLLFIEILFWKSRRECHLISAEYMLHELRSMRKESASGEIGSLQERGWVPRSLADALGEDEADVVLPQELGLEKMNKNVGDGQEENASNSHSNADEKEVGHEIKEAPKRKRRLVLTDELESRIKDLYEKFKDDVNCSRLIAESLDPEGLISSAQVYNKLKQLGLKVASKKSTLHRDGQFSSNLDKDGEKESAAHNFTNVEGDLLRESLTTRKRVRAFSKDHEEKIKALFEEFKGHKKCSHMIANALADDNSFTAAQVSRKLKQLGLRVPRQKRSEKDMSLRDEDLDEVPVEEHVSDDETLLSFSQRKRIGNKKANRSMHEEILNQEKESSGPSDNEFLSNLLRKSSKPVLKAKDTDLTAISTDKITTDGAKRDETTGMDIEDADKDMGFNEISREGSLEDKIDDGRSENSSGASPVKNGNDLPDYLEQMEEELADSEDEDASGAFTRNPVQRRRTRVIIDAEDDD